MNLKKTFKMKDKEITEEINKFLMEEEEELNKLIHEEEIIINEEINER